MQITISEDIIRIHVYHGLLEQEMTDQFHVLYLYLNVYISYSLGIIMIIDIGDPIFEVAEHWAHKSHDFDV